jgi:hypothetical protein
MNDSESPAASRPYGLAALKTASLIGGLVVLSAWAFELHTARAVTGWNGYLLGGFALSALSVAVYAWRFNRVLRIAGIELPLLATLRMQLLALFYHFFVPFSAGADLTRFAKLRALAPEHGPEVVRSFARANLPRPRPVFVSADK